MDTLKTHVLNINYCPCRSCDTMLEKLRIFPEVKEVREINTDAEPNRVIITITGDPSRVRKVLKKKKKKKNLVDFEQSSGIQDQRPMISPQTVDMTTQVCCPKCRRELKPRKSNKRFPCDGCKRDGFGTRNRCDDYNYDLHEECTSPECTISPEFFEGSIFEFCRQPRPRRVRSCYACGKDIYGFFYHCKSKLLDLHPCCSRLKLKLCGMDFVHRDKVVSSSSECMWCKKKRSSSAHKTGGCSYVSTSKKCCFHVYCITEMVHEAWKKGVIINDSTDDISTALKKMNLPLKMPNSDRKTVEEVTEILKMVSPFVAAIVGIISGDTLGIVVPLLEILIQLNS